MDLKEMPTDESPQSVTNTIPTTIDQQGYKLSEDGDQIEMLGRGRGRRGRKRENWS